MTRNAFVPSVQLRKQAIPGTLFTIKDVCELFNMGDRTVRKHIHEGRLESRVIFGRHYLTLLSVVQLWKDLLLDPWTRDSTLDLIETRCRAIGKDFDRQMLLDWIEDRTGQPVLSA